MKKTVKTLALILALIMSISVFSASSVFADDAAAGDTSTGGDATAAVIPTIPTVTEEEKEYREYFFHKDFNDDTKETINTNSKAAAVAEAGGFWLCNTDGGDYAVEGGYLKHLGTSYIDLQLMRINDYSVKEDFVLSVKMKPLSEGINGWFIEFLRRDSSGTKSGKILQFVDGNIVLGDKDLGKMALNEWILIEMAFHYNTTEKVFDSYKVMLNGTEVGEGTLDIDTLLLTQILHFRTFRNMSEYTYATDDINIIAGTKSILYAKDYGAEPPVEPDVPGDNTGDNTGDTSDTGSTEDTGNDNTDTKAPETNASETKAPETNAPETEAPAEEKGCGGYVGAMALLVPVLGIGIATVFRKKKD